MSIFGRRPNPKAVAAQLIEGLERGTLTFQKATEPTREELVSELLRLDSEFAAGIDRHVPGYLSVHSKNAPRLLSILNASSPKSLSLMLVKWREQVALVNEIDAEVRRSLAWLGALIMLASTALSTVTVFAYLWFGAKAATAVCGVAVVALGGFVFSPVLTRIARNAAGVRLGQVLLARSEMTAFIDLN